ncbi:MAG: Rrf2 family transcriptional regulator [Candidatus Omnitrophica bacterium]|nr:Rrf2 family transcriptional regulator [Candidatus Omnitrophota bacterium]
MRFTTKTEYGLVCLVYMAKHPEMDMVTTRDIGLRESYSMTYMEKILQKLRSSGIVIAYHGKHGGYSLAKQPSAITLRQIIEALEGSTFDVFCEPEVRKEIVCTHFCMCGVRPIWAKTKELLDHFFASVTLEMIARPEADVEGLLTAGGKK